MKKVLLSLATVVVGYAAYAQVVVAGVTPAAVQGNYNFTFQSACGSWPGETDDGTWGTFTTGGHDFNVNGYYIQAEAVLVEDGTPGLNAQGNPISQEGCGALTNSVGNGNDLTGKIAVIYRNTCSFVQKIKNAQDAGAVAAIIVNREDALIGMLGDAVDGPSVTIPAVFISNIDGATIVNSIEAGDHPEIFIGNKLEAFNNDAGAVVGEFLISDFGAGHNAIYDGFTPGIQVYNYGLLSQDITVTATIDGPGASADYTDVVGPVTVISGDTLAIFPGNTDEFVAWQLGVGNYPDGDYTLTYTIDIASGSDDFPFDNVYSAGFRIQGDIISHARADGSNLPIANSFPFNATTGYTSCMMFQEPNASALGVRGLYFAPSTDTSQFVLEGAELLLYAYQWDDTWTDIYTPGFTAFGDYFQNLTPITTASYIVPSDDDNGDIAYEEFDTPFLLQDDVRYLFCVESTDLTNEVTLGYDASIDYDANYSIIGQPIGPLNVDGTWYTGWTSATASSIGLRTFDPAELGLDDKQLLNGTVYPNPATTELNFSIDGEGAAVIEITDISGKSVRTENVTLTAGKTNVNIADLESGVYLINVILENGEAAQFNVVKK